MFNNVLVVNSCGDPYATLLHLATHPLNFIPFATIVLFRILLLDGKHSKSNELFFQDSKIWLGFVTPNKFISLQFVNPWSFLATQILNSYVKK